MSRFIRKGHTRVYFLPAVSNTASPTVAEFTAGTELTASIADLNGFSFKASQVDTPDLGSRQTKKIPGENSADDSSLDFYEDDTSNPIKTVLAKDVTGFIAIIPKNVSPATAVKCDLFPIQVGGNNRLFTVANEPAKYKVDFAITGDVIQDTTIA